MNGRHALQLFYVGPLLAWMAVIFLLSTPVGGPKNSTGMIVWALRRLDPLYLSSLSGYQLAQLNYAARKTPFPKAGTSSSGTNAASVVDKQRAKLLPGHSTPQPKRNMNSKERRWRPWVRG